MQQDPQRHGGQSHPGRRQNLRASQQTHRGWHRPLRRPALRLDGPRHAGGTGSELSRVWLARISGSISSSVSALRVCKAIKLTDACPTVSYCLEGAAPSKRARY